MKLHIAAFAIITLASALVMSPPRPARHDLRITFIDVGQGDAILRPVTVYLNAATCCSVIAEALLPHEVRT